METVFACMVGFPGSANLNMLTEILMEQRELPMQPILDHKNAKKCTDFSSVYDMMTIFKLVCLNCYLGLSVQNAITVFVCFPNGLHYIHVGIWRFYFLVKLKKGERKQIPIPMDKGRNMLGVMDETGQLEYGQVYVRYTDMKTKKLETLTGEMQLC